jgi:hypothetical protein
MERRIMKLSADELKEEAALEVGEEFSVLVDLAAAFHLAASWLLPQFA